MTDGPGPHPLTKIPGSSHVLIQILSYYLEKLSAYDKLHIVPIKGVEFKTWRCDVSEFRFKKVIYLSGI